ncbi:carboxypeptidase-like regulatory domain-containing protein [Gimesia sp.]|uniref:carboxypeptidase-like regulatory domain-containing protein n=1 Tax=Gimesia sp. TaxID=2024833 RepID=UPI003A8E3912
MLAFIQTTFRTLSSVHTTVLCSTLLLTLSLLSGCGGTTVASKPMGTVSGTVTLKGQPLSNCRVNFISEQLGASAGGDLTEEGSFTLDGPIPAGSYSVFISMPSEFTPAQAQSNKGLSQVPKKYLGSSTTDLKADVSEGESSHEFDLK